KYPDVNRVNQWSWSFDNGNNSGVEDPPSQVYSVFGTKTTRLIVSNGYCTDTATIHPQLDNAIQAAFEAPNILCPKDYATILDSSTGNLTSYNWNFGDGS